MVAPLAAVLSIAANVIISSKASDVRSAQLQGILVAIPFGAIYVASEIGVVTLNTGTLLIISAAVFVAAVILFSISAKTFRREEILTKWT